MLISKKESTSSKPLFPKSDCKIVSESFEKQYSFMTSNVTAAKQYFKSTGSPVLLASRRRVQSLLMMGSMAGTSSVTERFEKKGFNELRLRRWRS